MSKNGFGNSVLQTGTHLSAVFASYFASVTQTNGGMADK